MFLSLLFAINANAATLTVNGKSCGEIESAMLDKANAVSVKTNADCGGVAPQPVPTPVPQPAPCPVNTICASKAWPTIPQAMYSMRHDQVMSIKIKTTAAGVSGRLFTMYTTGNTASRHIVFSKDPASFVPVMARCETKGLEVANIYWVQGGSDTRKCTLPPDTDLYINIKFTNCEEGKSCSFYFGDT